AVRSVYRTRRRRQHLALHPNQCPASAGRTACAPPLLLARAGGQGLPPAARIVHPRSARIARPAEPCAGCPGANLPSGLEHSGLEAALLNRERSGLYLASF